jgi:cobalt-precorrin-5B (C1)-methyltransferase
MEDFVVIGGKKFRKGYTTGSCAAAAAKAAVVMLCKNIIIDNIEIDTPVGVKLNLAITEIENTKNFCECGVVKDGGDDPDATNGLVIKARAKFNNSGEVSVTGGQGVGKVTQPGLKVPIGEYAINPVPMKMIKDEVLKVLTPNRGVDITISVPGGEEIAKKTYNPRLGIVGGISILGTTGIVNPMSEEAWKEALSLEIGIAKAKGYKTLVYAFGNIGEDFVKNSIGINAENIIIISNFVGYMLEKAVENNIEKILVTGHIGKLIKVAAGIFNTHSRVADGRMETLTAYSGLEGANIETLKSIYECRTTDEAVNIIKKNHLNAVFERIVTESSRRCREYTFGKIDFGTLLFYWDNKILSCDKTGKEIVSELGGRII